MCRGPTWAWFEVIWSKTRGAPSNWSFAKNQPRPHQKTLKSLFLNQIGWNLQGMCPDKFYCNFDKINIFVTLLSLKLLQKLCFLHLTQYLQIHLMGAVAYFMKNFLSWGRESTLKKSGLSEARCMVQPQFYGQNLDMNFQKQFWTWKWPPIEKITPVLLLQLFELMK